MSRPPLLLGVNIDHSATLRQARYREEATSCGRYIEPDPLAIALAAEAAGADGITVHLREDRRHIVDRDIARIRESIATRMNLEMACTEEMTNIAIQTRPDSACLVPENRAEVTTEGGLDCVQQFARVSQTTKALQDSGIAVSLFIDPDLDQIAAAVSLGASMVEFHTGSYAHAWFDPTERRSELQRLRQACSAAAAQGLVVNAGHGINYINIGEILELPHLHELNIGHAIISRALLTGIGEAVREMKHRMNR
ncbi:MAG: pyridoxine 5'-phosphate synthase [Puniceicoccaceae bacterium]